MPLRLNLLPVQISRPSCILPFLPVPKGKKPKEVYEGLYDEKNAARLVWKPGGSHIVFLRGGAPEGYGCGTQIYEWTDTGGLPRALIEYAISDHLADRCRISFRYIDRKPHGCFALSPVSGKTYEHLIFEEGVYFRADSLEGQRDYVLIVDWCARVRFSKNLDNPEMRDIAVGASVILTDFNPPPDLLRYQNRYLGHVVAVSADTATVRLRNHETRDLPTAWLQIESSTGNLAAFNKKFPQFSPRIGVNITRLQLDKTLVGMTRNQRLHKDRLDAAIRYLFQAGTTNLSLPAPMGQDIEVGIRASPIQPSDKGDAFPKVFTLPQPEFLYRNDAKHETRKKIDGMVKVGPHDPPPILAPRYGFVFASRHRQEARKLFAALRDGAGAGYFRGLQAWFGLPLKNDSVVSIGDFEVPVAASDREAAGAYTRALKDWLRSAEVKPDIFFIVHDKTEDEADVSPYYACKALLLSHGIMTQNVTVDLIDNATQFQWAAANIALGAFTKLGGTPWTLEPSSTRQSLVIGMGRAERHDALSRSGKKCQAFATCSSSDGRFGFVSVYPEADASDIAESLGKAANSALCQAEALKLPYDSLVIHLTGDLKATDREAVEAAAKAFKPAEDVPVCVISVSEDSDVYAISDKNLQGIPGRGEVVRLAEADFLVFTEGAEDLAAARFRTPCSVRVRTKSLPTGVDPIPLIAQVYDLSQVNFRAFNGASKPVSVLYSTLLARTLRHEGISEALAANPDLNKRMWFL